MLNADPTAIQQINFTGNLDGDGNTTMFFITEEAKETALDFLQGAVRVFKYSSDSSNFKTFIKCG